MLVKLAAAERGGRRADRRGAARLARAERPSADRRRPRRATRCTSSRSCRCSSRPAPSSAAPTAGSPSAGAEQLQIPPTVQALVASRLDALQSGGAGGRRPGVGDRPVVPDRRGRRSSSTRPFARGSATDLEVLAGEAARPPPARGGGHLPLRPPDHPRHGVRQPAQARPRRRCTSGSSTWAERVNRERGRELEFEEILGYHLEQAYRYRTELGVIDAEAREVGERAAAKLSSAGRRALARGDMPGRRRACSVEPSSLLVAEAPTRASSCWSTSARRSSQQGAFDEARRSSTRRWRSATRSSAMRGSGHALACSRAIGRPFSGSSARGRARGRSRSRQSAHRRSSRRSATMPVSRAPGELISMPGSPRASSTRPLRRPSASIEHATAGEERLGCVAKRADDRLHPRPRLHAGRPRRCASCEELCSTVARRSQVGGDRPAVARAAARDGGRVRRGARDHYRARPGDPRRARRRAWTRSRRRSTSAGSSCSRATSRPPSASSGVTTTRSRRSARPTSDRRWRPCSAGVLVAAGDARRGDERFAADRAGSSPRTRTSSRRFCGESPEPGRLPGPGGPTRRSRSPSEAVMLADGTVDIELRADALAGLGHSLAEAAATGRPCEAVFGRPLHSMRRKGDVLSAARVRAELARPRASPGRFGGGLEPALAAAVAIQPGFDLEVVTNLRDGDALDARGPSAALSYCTESRSSTASRGSRSRVGTWIRTMLSDGGAAGNACSRAR